MGEEECGAKAGRGGGGAEVGRVEVGGGRGVRVGVGVGVGAAVGGGNGAGVGVVDTTRVLQAPPAPAVVVASMHRRPKRKSAPDYPNRLVLAQTNNVITI